MTNKVKPKIYDCFTFFNELDLLEIRLNELDSVVDFFVIVEADKTHAGEPKEFILEKNMKRFNRWKDKIIYLKVEMPEFNFFDRLLISLERITKGFITRFIGSNFRRGKWKLENFQREQIARGLTKCNDKDIILVSDIDEIPNKESILKAEKILEKDYIKVGFKQTLFFYFLNMQSKLPWIGTKAVSYGFLIKNLQNNAQLIRLRRFHFILENLGIREKIKILDNAGWHFSHLVGNNKKNLVTKIKSRAEGDLADDKKIESMFKRNCFIGTGEKLRIISKKNLPKSAIAKKFHNLIKHI